jgi:hypothetical protein
MYNLFHLISTTIPPTTIPHASTQESLFHEPWQVLLALLITSLAGILGAVAAIMGARRAKAAKHEAVRVAVGVKEQFENAVGTPNGHGSLMDQNLVLLQNQHNIQQAMARDSSALADHITQADYRLEHINEKLSKLDGVLNEHVKESTVYRSGVKDKLQTVETKLDDHVAWEMSQKYMVIPKTADLSEKQKPSPRKKPSSGES